MCAKQAAVSDKFLEYAENAAQRLKEKYIRIEVTDRMKCPAVWSILKATEKGYLLFRRDGHERSIQILN